MKNNLFSDSEHSKEDSKIELIDVSDKSDEEKLRLLTYVEQNQVGIMSKIN